MCYIVRIFLSHNLYHSYVKKYKRIAVVYTSINDFYNVKNLLYNILKEVNCVKFYVLIPSEKYIRYIDFYFKEIEREFKNIKKLQVKYIIFK